MMFQSYWPKGYVDKRYEDTVEQNGGLRKGRNSFSSAANYIVGI